MQAAALRGHASYLVASLMQFKKRQEKAHIKNWSIVYDWILPVDF